MREISEGPHGPLPLEGGGTGRGSIHGKAPAEARSPSKASSSPSRRARSPPSRSATACFIRNSATATSPWSTATSSRSSSIRPARSAWWIVSCSGRDMTHYVAIVEDAGPEKAVGIWFPDLPGCFSAGDDIDEALRNAPEALTLYAEAEAEEGHTLPPPRTLSALRNDPATARDLRDHMVALVAFSPAAAHAAE